VFFIPSFFRIFFGKSYYPLNKPTLDRSSFEYNFFLQQLSFFPVAFHLYFPSFLNKKCSLMTPLEVKLQSFFGPSEHPPNPIPTDPQSLSLFLPPSSFPIVLSPSRPNDRPFASCVGKIVHAAIHSSCVPLFFFPLFPVYQLVKVGN